MESRRGGGGWIRGGEEANGSDGWIVQEGKWVIKVMLRKSISLIIFLIKF